MSKMIYEIRAYSPSKNEVQREFDQDALQGRPTQTAVLAQRKADAFAYRLNLQKKLRVDDWEGQIVLISTMI
tara:strand:+ start:17441 stop:17656 length:216 start_codon:yes stop_codon:yes gene_type:complete